jgi:uncharacterized SAM-binding protein YcdF (DUF218 family)
MSFLFLSKLLPLLIYPVGFACLLLLIALILLWKYPRWAMIPVGFALIVLCLSSNGLVANYLLKSLEWQYLPSDLSQADAIVILGGATRTPASPRPMVDVTEQGDRILYGGKLYLDGKAPVIIAAGGRAQWRGGGNPESQDMLELLKLMGIPETAIIQEPLSLNTYENAVNVKKILQEKNLKKVLLVTSALHTPRAYAIFKKQGMEVIPAPTDFLISEQELSEIEDNTESLLLNLLPDAIALDRTTKVFKEYIGTFIYWLKGWL